MFSCSWLHWDRKQQNLWEEPEQCLTSGPGLELWLLEEEIPSWNFLGGNFLYSGPGIAAWAVKPLQPLFLGTDWDKSGTNPLQSTCSEGRTQR